MNCKFKKETFVYNFLSTLKYIFKFLRTNCKLFFWCFVYTIAVQSSYNKKSRSSYFVHEKMLQFYPYNEDDFLLMLLSLPRIFQIECLHGNKEKLLIDNFFCLNLSCLCNVYVYWYKQRQINLDLVKTMQRLSIISHF